MWRKWIEERRARKTPQQGELDLVSVKMRLSVLEDRQEQLEDQYRRLRGYVYSKKGLVGPPGEPPAGDLPAGFVGPAAPTASAQTPPPTISREELRRQLTLSGRFVPGRPAVHSEKPK